jgi:hypothetical protein
LGVHAGSQQEREEQDRETHSHLSRRSLDLDLVWWDKFGLIFPTPLDGAFDALARVIELPLGCAHIACDGIWPIEPAAFP